MARQKTTYSVRREWERPAGYGINVSEPIAGFYKVKLSRDTVLRAVHLVYGPPRDPITGEELDRSWRWMAFLDDGSLANFDDIWPKCARDPITEIDWKQSVARTEWAKINAPDSAYANPRKRRDPLSKDEPLPF